jgi:hypothetical protein
MNRHTFVGLLVALFGTDAASPAGPAAAHRPPPSPSIRRPRGPGNPPPITFVDGDVQAMQASPQPCPSY